MSEFTFESFKFFNDQFNLVSEEELTEILEKDNEGRYIYFCNDTLKERGIYLIFDFVRKSISHTNLATENKEDIIKINGARYNKGRNFFMFDVDEDMEVVIDRFDNYYTVEGEKLNFFYTKEDYEKYLIESVFSRDIGNNVFISDFFGIKPAIKIEPKNDFQACVWILLNVKEYRIKDKNYRLTLWKEYYSYGRSDYHLEVYAEDSPYYNLMDTGRIKFENSAYNRDHKFIYLPMEANEYDYEDRLLIPDKLCKTLKRHTERLLRRNEFLVSIQIFNYFKEKYTFFEEYREHGKNIKEIKVVEKYKEFLRNGKDIIINGIVMNNNMIWFKEENFKIEFDDNFLSEADIQRKFYDIYQLLKADDVRYNFNVFYEKLLKMSKLNCIQPQGSHYSFKKCEFIVNNLLLTVEKRGDRFYINDTFVRIYDVLYLLTNIICYNDRNEYNKYLKKVSFIGLKFIRMINTGINIEFNYDLRLFEGTMPMVRLSLLWDSEKRRNIYVYMNKTKYRIKDKRAFLKHFNNAKIMTNFSRLKKCFKEVLDGFVEKDFFVILKEAIEEGKIVKQRGEQLVADTLKDINAELTTININNLKIVGYKLKGKITQTMYFIKRSDLDVFKFMNGKWNKRCVVDRSDKQRIYEDRLANRLVNIYNEPEYIHTIH